MVGTGLNQFETVWNGGNQFKPVEAGFYIKKKKTYSYWFESNKKVYDIDLKKYNNDNACKDNNDSKDTNNKNKIFTYNFF